MKYSLEDVEKVLGEKRKQLLNYCEYLAKKYNQTLEGKYRIKYNDLFSLLYFPCLSDEQKVLFFNSFAKSLDIYPIEDIKTLKLKEF